MVSSRVDGRPPGYLNPHTGEDHLIEQQYLPAEAAGRIIYRPTRQGKEAETADRIEEWDRRLGRPPRRGKPSNQTPGV